MSAVILVLVATAGVLGLLMGGRHLYLRLDRPHGFECSLRVVRGEVPGLGSRFRAGYAGPEMRVLLWRRVAWPGPRVRIPVEAVRIDRFRRPHAGERLAVPATFTIVPVELDPDTSLELALPARRIDRLVGLLDS